MKVVHQSFANNVSKDIHFTKVNVLILKKGVLLLEVRMVYVVDAKLDISIVGINVLKEICKFSAAIF